MKIKRYMKIYDSVVDYDRSLPVQKQTLQVSKQLKAVRDDMCMRAPTYQKVLEAQYAYVIASLNQRHRLWAYDYMTFPRRIGELWESFCKAAFYNARTPIRPFTPPEFNEVKKLIGTKKVPNTVWDLVGDVNLKNDGMFYYRRKLHVIDLKSSFNSHEKGNFQRLKTVAMVYKLWKPSASLNILVREDEENVAYLDGLSEHWNVTCGASAYDVMADLTGIDLGDWIQEHVNFKGDLDPNFYRFVEDSGMEKYLKW